jgi:hypothetical protein
LKTFFAFFILLWSFLGLHAQKMKLEEMIPEDTLAYVTLDDLAGLQKQAKSHPYLKVFYESWFKEIVFAAVEKFEIYVFPDFRPLFGMNLSDLLEIPGGQISFIFHDFTIQSGQEPEPYHFSFTVLVEFQPEEKKKVTDLVDRMTTFMQENLKKQNGQIVKAESEIAPGARLTEMSILKSDGSTWDEHLYYVMSKTHFALGVQNRDEMVKIFRALSGEKVPESLARSATGREYLPVISPQSFLRGYLNIRRLYEIFVTMFPEYKENLEKYLPVLGLQSLEHLSFSFGFSSQTTEMSLYAYCPGPKRGLLKLLDTRSGNLTPQPFVSSDLLYYGTCYLNLLDLYREFRETASYEPAVDVEVDAVVQEINRATELDLETDILASLGNRISFITYNEKKGEVPEALFLMELASPSKFVLARDRLVKGLEINDFKEEEFMGKALWVIPETSAGGQGLSPSYFIDDNHFCFAPKKSALQAFIKRSKESKTALKDHSSYKALSGQHLPGAGLLLFTNIPEKSAVLDDLNSSETQTFLELIGIDPSKIPSYEQLKPYLQVSASSYRSDGQGFLLKSVSTTAK